MSCKMNNVLMNINETHVLRMYKIGKNEPHKCHYAVLTTGIYLFSSMTLPISDAVTVVNAYKLMNYVFPR